MRPIKNSSEVESFTTRRAAVIDGDREAAEMLHTFLRLMGLECSLLDPGPNAVATIRRLDPDVVILDLDLPDLRALEIAREIRAPVIFVTEEDPALVDVAAPVMRKPRDRFEELLKLFELVLALEE